MKKKTFRFSARTLEYVETYLNSPYSLDAWILLSMVASNIKSKTPQFVYFKLQDNLCDFVSTNESTSHSNRLEKTREPPQNSVAATNP